MILNRSKRTFSSVNEFKAYFATQPKVPNYYEILKVSQNSTQDDIKSAYYELSKKYHPDVNKSSNAKKNFQDVSDAYEILGNFNKRKMYDRDRLARGVGYRKAQTFTDTDADPLAGFYKSRQSKGDYNPNRASASSQAKFDFDQWTRAHYGSTLKRSLRDKSNKVLKEKIQIEYEKEKEKNKATAIVTLSTVMMVLGLLSMYTHYLRTQFDKNLISNNKK